MGVVLRGRGRWGGDARAGSPRHAGRWLGCPVAMGAGDCVDPSAGVRVDVHLCEPPGEPGRVGEGQDETDPLGPDLAQFWL